MVLDPTDRPTQVDIVVEPKAQRPPLGILLTLLAIGLALAPGQTIKALVQFDQLQPAGTVAKIMIVGEIVRSVWTIANLVLLVKRSQRFPRSMIALIGYSLLLGIIDIAVVLPLATHAESLELLGALGIGIVIAGLWITYFVRSQHVRDVFVR